MSPTYKNVTSLRVTLDGKVIEPGKEVSTLIYYDENEVGLLKTNDKPCFTPTLFSELIDKDREILIPIFDNMRTKISKFTIHFYLEKGEVEIFYNSFDNLPSLKLYEGARWNNRYFDRRVSKIFIRGRSKRFALWVEIEKIF